MFVSQKPKEERILGRDLWKSQGGWGLRSGHWLQGRKECWPRRTLHSYCIFLLLKIFYHEDISYVKKL